VSKFWKFATLVAGLVVFSSQAAQAQNPGGNFGAGAPGTGVPGAGAPAAGAPAAGGPSPGQNAPRFGVAVVDVTYIFKNYQRFNAMMNQMKTDVEATEKALAEERRLINQEVELLNSKFQPGTPEFQREDDRITELKTKFNLKMTKQRKEFLDREAKIYYQAHLEVNDAVKYYALRHNLGLVLRFNGDPIDPNDRQDVLRAINNPVVFQNGIDITPDVLRDLDRSGGGAAAPAGGIGTRPSVPTVPGKR
jgi:Skp family chaperone for outer membrane proteins